MISRSEKNEKLRMIKEKQKWEDRKTVGHHRYVNIKTSTKASET